MGRTIIAGNDVGDVRSVPSSAWRRNRAWSAVDRIGIRRKGSVGPAFTDEVVATHDFGCREQTICARVLRIRCAGAVRGQISRRSPCASEKFVCVIDAGIQDGHAYAGTIEAEILDSRGSDVRHRLGQIQ